MKGLKYFTLMLALLFLIYGTSDAAVTKVSAGTDSYGIAFTRIIQSLTIIPYTQNISVEFFVGTTQVDSFEVLYSAPLANIPVPCDSINIIRPNSTAVMIIPNYGDRRDVVIAGNSVQATFLDSLVELSSSPTPVTVTAPGDIVFQGLNLKPGTTSASLFSTGSRIYPQAGAGISLDGAKALLVAFSWTRWADAGFTLYNVFTNNSTDTAVTSMNYCSGGPDSISMDDSTGVVEWAGGNAVRTKDNGSFTFQIDVPAGAGYYRAIIAPHGAGLVNITGLSQVVRKVY